MDMVVVVHPTLEEYSEQVHAIAKRHGLASWLELIECPEKMSKEERDDFSFITMAVGDKLIHREFISPSWSPGEDNKADIELEPGMIPGSTVLLGVKIGCPWLCGTHR